MAVSGTVPSARKVGFDPLPPSRWLRRATWVLAIVAGIVFFAWFGTQRVPAGMDTVPSIPPGSLCIIDRRQGAAKVGSHVFLDVPAGGTVLSEVTAADEEKVFVLHPNAASALPDSRSFGPLPRSSVRSTVLVVFPPDQVPAGNLHGK
jgi:hypothetical protein